MGAGSVILVFKEHGKDGGKEKRRRSARLSGRKRLAGFGLSGNILFPLLSLATTTVAVIKTITIINDMYIPYLYMPKNKLRTLTTFLMDCANAQQGSWQALQRVHSKNNLFGRYYPCLSHPLTFAGSPTPPCLR